MFISKGFPSQRVFPFSKKANAQIPNGNVRMPTPLYLLLFQLIPYLYIFNCLTVPTNYIYSLAQSLHFLTKWKPKVSNFDNGLVRFRQELLLFDMIIYYLLPNRHTPLETMGVFRWWKLSSSFVSYYLIYLMLSGSVLKYFRKI